MGNRTTNATEMVSMPEHTTHNEHDGRTRRDLDLGFCVRLALLAVLGVLLLQGCISGGAERLSEKQREDFRRRPQPLADAS